MAKSVKFAVILSGCGVYDGSEIHEATLTLYSIAKNGGTYEIFAPDMQQFHVINHITGEEMGEKRNVLVESARIARGKINPLNEFDINDFEALIFPGGFGAAKNLSTYGIDGVNFTINIEVRSAVTNMVAAGKPIGALCITPVVIAKLLSDVELTIGLDQSTITDIENMGAKHIKAGPTEIVIDWNKKVIATPCYMLESPIDQIAQGINNVVKAIIDMV